MDYSKELTHISLCAGYGGIDIGLKRAVGAIRTVAFSEIESFACANLVSKMESGLLDRAPIWTDLKTFPWSGFRGKVDLLSGGFPCQPFSSAGQRAGDEDPRHLFPHIVRGIRELERPPIVFFENVEGIINSKLKGDDWNDPQGTPVLLHVIRELERLGYSATAGVFSASEIGAPHQRKRVFILGVRADIGRGGREVVNNLLGNTESRGCKWTGGRGQSTEQGVPLQVREPSADGKNLADSKGVGGSGECGTAHDSRAEGVSQEQRTISLSGSANAVANSNDTGDSTPSHDTNTNGEAGGDKRGWVEPWSEPIRRSHTCGAGEPSIVATLFPAGRGAPQYRWEPPRVTPREQGKAVGDSNSEGLQGRNPDEREVADEGRNSQAESVATAGAKPRRVSRRAKSTMGGDTDGHTGRLDYAGLCVTVESRTDELRLLGNGVVPATAERAFRVLWKRLDDANG